MPRASFYLHLSALHKIDDLVFTIVQHKQKYAC